MSAISERKTQPMAVASHYIIAVVAAALAVLPWAVPGKHPEPSIFLLFLAAVIFASWYGGLKPGLLTAVIGAAASLYFFAPRPHGNLVDIIPFAVQLALFLLVAICISYLNGAVRKAREESPELDERLQRQLDFTEALTRNIDEGVYALDRRGRVTFVNPAAQKMLGWSEEELLGKEMDGVIHAPGDSDSRHSALEALQGGGTVRVASDQYRSKDGTTFPVDSVASPTRRNGRITGVVVAFRDMTERHAFEERLQHQALHDALTDLPNRTLFDDRLRHAIQESKRNECSFALLLIDLDRFKDINDTFGHLYGDLLLQELGLRLQRVLRESDTVARLGGDEFAMLLPATDARGAVLVAEKVFTALQRPFVLEGQNLDVDGSIGITIYPDHGSDATALLQRADVAMYVAKRSNEGHAIYTPDRDLHSPTRLLLMGELRQAIERNELVLHYQPKVKVSTGSRQGVEALVRWQHPTRGLLSPDQFVPLAEHTGMIKALNLWVLNEALHQIQAWQTNGIDMHVAVNISARNLHDPQLPDTIARLLTTWHVQADRLCVEITESTVMADPPRALQVLRRLHEMGVCISIDDFGTGYSSLAYLARLPADEIKIDRSFVQDMVVNADGAHIARSVIDLGHNLGLEVVAEGVENQQALDMLARLGCDVVQGYYLGRPVIAQTYLQPASVG